MNEKIVETLKLMCDKTNSQDKKIILLAELVEDRCTALGDNQANLQKSLNNTNAKLDKLTELLEKYEGETHGCPVYKNKVGYEKLSFYIKNPKISILIIIGMIALVGGFFGSTFSDLIKGIFGL